MKLGSLAAAATVAAAALTAAPAPAHASSTVTVKFGLSAGTWAPTGAACPVTVDEGANGLAVLAAASAALCIVSYDTVAYECCGTFVTCIDFVCGTAGMVPAVPGAPLVGTFWGMYENGGLTGYGVDAFTADEGDELVFAYQPFCYGFPCP